MDLIGGIPVHPLVVHAVVVLLPLAALGTLAVVARRRWRRAWGVPVLLIAIAGVVCVPIAARAGEQLRAALPPNPLIETHEERAELLLPFAVAFVVLLAATVLVGRVADRPADGDAARSRAELAVGLLAAVAGIAVTGLVVWIGHAGSVAVWSGLVP
jgi:hypothetical protein